MDFIEGLFKSNGKNVFYVMIDIFGKYVHFIVIAHPHFVVIVTTVFMKNMYKLHGFSSMIVSDYCDIMVTQINYHSLNKLDIIEQAKGRSYEEDLIQVFMLDDMKLGGF